MISITHTHPQPHEQNTPPPPQGIQKEQPYSQPEPQTYFQIQHIKVFQNPFNFQFPDRGHRRPSHTPASEPRVSIARLFVGGARSAEEGAWLRPLGPIGALVGGAWSPSRGRSREVRSVFGRRSRATRPVRRPRRIATDAVFNYLSTNTVLFNCRINKRYTDTCEQ